MRREGVGRGEAGDIDDFVTAERGSAETLVGPAWSCDAGIEEDAQALCTR